MSPLRYGFQMVAPYSMIDLTRVTYVVFRHVSGTFLKFLLRKPSFALAFLHTLLMWMLHFRSFEIWSGATIWNPYLKGDIDKLERIQNKAIRFVKKDYKSRETGAITRMREDLELETLEDRRLSLRLILMYKVVEGLVPALPTDSFVKLARPKRNIG
jgi:hypothetical protein